MANEICDNCFENAGFTHCDVCDKTKPDEEIDWEHGHRDEVWYENICIACWREGKAPDTEGWRGKCRARLVSTGLRQTCSRKTTETNPFHCKQHEKMLARIARNSKTVDEMLAKAYLRKATSLVRSAGVALKAIG